MSRFPSLTPAQIEASKQIEQQRDAACLKVPCPVCNARPGSVCRHTNKTGYGPTAHTGRYRLAVEAGLVPRLVGDRG